MSAEILIIDDNADIRLILEELIQDAGYKTRLAANYNQALTEIDKKIPDVAIIDVKLDKGDTDGIELLNHIKKKNKDIPVIIIAVHPNILPSIKFDLLISLIKWFTCLLITLLNFFLKLLSEPS